VRRNCCYLFVLLLFAGIQLAQAQSSFDVAVGFGAVQDKATGTGIEGDPNSANFFNTCAAGATLTCASTKSMSGLMMGFQGNLMLSRYLGVGGELSFQPGRQDYVVYPPSVLNLGGANLQSRTTFYDFNGIFQPVKNKRVALQVLGGIGGANLRFYASGSTTSAVLGTQNFSQFYGSSNHFQVHGGFGVQLFVNDHVFVRPQFDVHYVPNLTQFGRNVVTEESVWVGYSWGTQ
jgi:outer membrane protein with beta-barrel domain